MDRPPILRLKELHFLLGWIRRQGKETSLSIQCFFLALGNSGKSSLPPNQTRYSEGLGAQEATSPCHQWHPSLLLRTAPPSGESQLCTMPRRRSGESTVRGKREKRGSESLKDNLFPTSTAPAPNLFHLHRFIINSTILVAFHSFGNISNISKYII